MKKKELYKALNSLCDKLDEEYQINYGGCCYVASIIVRYLEQYNISFEIVCYDFGNHFAVKTKSCILNKFDDMGVKQFYNWTSLQTSYHYYHNEWNEVYDTKYNGIVALRIRNIFVKYAK